MPKHRMPLTPKEIAEITGGSGRDWGGLKNCSVQISVFQRCISATLVPVRPGVWRGELLTSKIGHSPME